HSRRQIRKFCQALEIASSGENDLVLASICARQRRTSAEPDMTQCFAMVNLGGHVIMGRRQIKARVVASRQIESGAPTRKGFQSVQIHLRARRSKYLRQCFSGRQSIAPLSD